MNNLKLKNTFSMASSQWHLKSGNRAFLSLRKNMEFGLNSQMTPLTVAQWCNNVLNWGMPYFRLCQRKFRINAVKKCQPQSGSRDLSGDLHRYLCNFFFVFHDVRIRSSLAFESSQYISLKLPVNKKQYRYTSIHSLGCELDYKSGTRVPSTTLAFWAFICLL